MSTCDTSFGTSLQSVSESQLKGNAGEAAGVSHYKACTFSTAASNQSECCTEEAQIGAT